MTDSKNWRECSRCGMERRATYPRGVVSGHRRWDPARREMVPCEGSGKIGIPMGASTPVRVSFCAQCGQSLLAA